MSGDRRGAAGFVHLVLFFVAVLFSLNYIFSKIALREISPLAFTYLRVCGSALLLAVIGIRSRSETVSRADWRAILLYTVLGVVINQILFIGGLSLTSAHEAAMLITTIPIFTLIAAIALSRESGSIAKFGGIALAAAGALVLIGSKGAHGMRGSVAGDAMILVNCASYGLYLVLSKPMMLRLPARAVIQRMFYAGVPLMFPLTITAVVRQDWRSVSPAAWLAAAGVIAGPTVAAYILNAWALARAESSVVAAYSYLQPFVATILAAIFLGEVIKPVFFVSGVMIFAGVFLASRSRA